MRSFFISVIIPTLNEERFLPKLLNDLKNQKDNDFEVLVIDGHSKDATKKITFDFKNDLNLRFFEVEKRNVSYQRNYGANQAKGKYLCFFDADMRIAPAFIKKIKKEMQKTMHLVFIPSVVPQDKSIHDMVTFNLVNFLIETSLFTNKPFSSGGSMIFERNFFLFLGGFDEKLFLAEDHEIIQRAKQAGVTAQMLHQTKVKISLRRLKKEGRLDLYRKYLVATLHTIRNGKIHKKIFEYKMGGDYYTPDNRQPRSFQTIRKHFTNLIRQLDLLISD